MKEIKAYVCDFCPPTQKPRARINKTLAVKHEAWCFWNPATRSCVTCCFLAQDEEGKACLADQKKYGFTGLYQVGKMQTQCHSWNPIGSKQE